jgi:hypothetical protein
VIPTKREIRKNGKTQWELDYGTDATGHRRRSFHQLEADADGEINSVKKLAKSHGEFWVGMTEVNRSAVVSVLTSARY